MKTTKIIQIIGLAALCACVVGPAEARIDRTSSGKPFALWRADSVGIARFAEIHPGLCRGGEPYEHGLKYLHDKGYKTVVSFLTDSGESVTVVNSGMKYIHIPMRSGAFSAEPPTDEQVRQFLAVVKDSSLYPVYFHCHAGKDRTGAMSAIYRMEVCGWSKDEALEEMKAFGFSWRYKRLYSYVENYKPQPLPASAPSVMTSAAAPGAATKSAAEPNIAPKPAPSAAAGSEPAVTTATQQ